MTRSACVQARCCRRARSSLTVCCISTRQWPSAGSSSCEQAMACTTVSRAPNSFWMAVAHSRALQLCGPRSMAHTIFPNGMACARGGSSRCTPVQTGQSESCSTLAAMDPTMNCRNGRRIQAWASRSGRRSGPARNPQSAAPVRLPAPPVWLLCPPVRRPGRSPALSRLERRDWRTTRSTSTRRSPVSQIAVESAHVTTSTRNENDSPGSWQGKRGFHYRIRGL
jgi:hypothetical protein